MLPGVYTALPLPKRQPLNLPPTQQSKDKPPDSDQVQEQREQRNRQDSIHPGYAPLIRRFKFPPTLLQTPGLPYPASFTRVNYRPPDPYPHLKIMKAIVDDLIETADIMEIPESPRLAEFLFIALHEEWLRLLEYVYDRLIPLETNLFYLGTRLMILGRKLGYEDVLESIRRVLNQVYSQLPLTKDGFPVSFTWPQEEVFDEDNDRNGPRWLLAQVLEAIGLMRKKKEWETLCQGRLEVWRVEAAKRGVCVGD